MVWHEATIRSHSIYLSDLRRTRQTVQTLSPQHHSPHSPCHGWCVLICCSLSGQTKGTLLAVKRVARSAARCPWCAEAPWCPRPVVCVCMCVCVDCSVRRVTTLSQLHVWSKYSYVGDDKMVTRLRCSQITGECWTKCSQMSLVWSRWWWRSWWSWWWWYCLRTVWFECLVFLYWRNYVWSVYCVIDANVCGLHAGVLST